MLTRIVVVLVLASSLYADVFSYECESLPTDAGFSVVQVWCDPVEWVQDGCLFQHVDECPECPPPGGQQFVYDKSLLDFLDSESFFVEWKIETDGSSDQINFGAPAGFTAAGGIVDYRFRIATDKAKLNRDNLLPIVFVDIEPGAPHVFRLESVSDTLYVWYIDGQIVDQGVPEGDYPSGSNPRILMDASFYTSPSTTKWHYVRWGDLPGVGSLDFNTDGLVDEFETPFFAECMLGPGLDAGPGCRWADTDADTDVDCTDRDAFIAAWTGAGDPPPLAACLGPAAPIPAVSHWGAVVLILSLGIAGSLVFRQRNQLLC